VATWWSLFSELRSDFLFFYGSQEYHELLEEFMTAVKQNYGEKVLTQVSQWNTCSLFGLYLCAEPSI
jgi:hypothetical protein